MTFDPLKFYEDGKRRESRWGTVTPFILVGLLLLVMGVDGYISYKVGRSKTKPAAEIVTVSCSDPAGCRDDGGGKLTHNETDGPYVPPNGFGAYAFQDQRRRKSSWSDDHACYRETLDANRNPVDTAIVCPEDEPRHKRKPAFPVPPEDSDIGSGSNTIGEWFCDKCSEHQMTETTKDTQVIWEEKTKPSDITNLMEQIAPTDKQEPKPAKDHLYTDRFGEKSYTQDDGPDGGCPMFCPPAKPDCSKLTGAEYRQCQGSYKNGLDPVQARYPSNEHLKPWVPIGKPVFDCKMPADIDVCPTQTLDKKGKP